MTNVDERLPVRRGHMEAGELAEPIDAYAATCLDSATPR